MPEVAREVVHNLLAARDAADQPVVHQGDDRPQGARLRRARPRLLELHQAARRDGAARGCSSASSMAGSGTWCRPRPRWSRWTRRRRWISRSRLIRWKPWSRSRPLPIATATGTDYLVVIASRHAPRTCLLISSTPTAARHLSEHRRAVAAHLLASRAITSRLAPTLRREVGLVDDQQIRLGDAGAALARHLVSAGDVDHVYRVVHELAAVLRGEVVAAALDEQQLGLRRSSSAPRARAGSG